MAGFVINNTYILHLHIDVFNFLFWSTVFAQEFDLFSIILNDDYTGELVLENYTATAGRPTDVRMFSVKYMSLFVCKCLFVDKRPIQYSLLCVLPPQRREREIFNGASISKVICVHPHREAISALTIGD